MESINGKLEKKSVFSPHCGSEQPHAMPEPIVLALKRLAFPKASALGNAENKNSISTKAFGTGGKTGAPLSSEKFFLLSSIPRRRYAYG